MLFAVFIIREKKPPEGGGTEICMKRLCKALAALALLVAVVTNIIGCSSEIEARNLSRGIATNTVKPLEELDGGNAAVTDFALRLLEAVEREEGGNTLLSPLSVMTALAMTANGAGGETLSEMESVLGMTVPELNLYFYSLMRALPEGNKYALSLANSMWVNSDARFTPSERFLGLNADYYGASVYESDFGTQTKRDINNWVKQSTNGMIPKILDRVPENAIMYLVNALAFEAEWSEIYERRQVRDGTFTCEDGKKQRTKMMYSNEYGYFEDGGASGFIKHYSGRKYAFVALLPKEGVSLAEYIASLDGESLGSLLQSPEPLAVKASIPKFEVEFGEDISGALAAMGMDDAFDIQRADFSGLGSSEEGNIFINRVMHKTYIEVAEQGTRAGAATSVEMGDGSAGPPDEIKEVHLDRPFMYMIIDCENRVPLFVGTMRDV